MAQPENATSAAQSGPYDWIGSSVPKVDALDKALGITQYVGDMQMPGMLHARIRWSGVPHAIIRGIDTSEAVKVPGVRAVLTAGDIPGINRYGLAVQDQRVLADDKVRTAADPVALVAADTEQAAEEAITKIKLDLEPLRPILSIEDALDPTAPSIHESGNLFTRTTVRKGDLDQGVKESDVIVEETYRTHLMDHMAMETESSLAYMDPTGVLTIITSTQYPYRDRRQIAPALNLSMNKVRVVQAPIGGGFGRKDDITSEIHAGLLALKTQRPVRLVYTRRDSLIANTKRHPMLMKFRTGARSDGRLTFVDADIYGDTGAYLSLGAFVIKKAGIHACGPYDVPNIRVDTHTLYTNNLSSGAMRGFGVLQAAVAHESQMDQLAHRLGISPIDIRLINTLKPGLATGTGQVMDEGCGIEATVLRIKEYMESHDLRFTRS
ncbi:MAG: nicotinate dehydrogenase large molybdopterin subunit [Chloroflexi bacterium]|jgi:CO/xanthine dehydrogenase Mo-binding subunit|nr:nicotinate dehydrogenase large molybdopterin subunit [Chloroflexota bacterium]MEE2925851.1 molybdopterin cofactor-binding domain-containing protein [Chloroflexota bacterium]|tara:strand:+ start:6904 stop:8214 length:1311 start_codon:yes stop_codon:yes gene_type:complete